jgi:5-methylcytosine-specific restriction endonuclease McrA
MNVEDRDKGICAYCKQDCTSQKLLLDEVRKDDRLLFLREIKKLGLSESTYDKRKVLWDLDHRVRVADGGGSASLDNLQTLCLTCHKTKTAYENSVTKKGRKRK